MTPLHKKQLVMLELIGTKITYYGNYCIFNYTYSFKTPNKFLK